MGNLRDFSRWLTTPNPATSTLRERQRSRALERREARIMNLARQMWEEDGKPCFRFERREIYYKSKAVERLESQKKNHPIMYSFLLLA